MARHWDAGGSLQLQWGQGEEERVPTSGTPKCLSCGGEGSVSENELLENKRYLEAEGWGEGRRRSVLVREFLSKNKLEGFRRI